MNVPRLDIFLKRTFFDEIINLRVVLLVILSNYSLKFELQPTVTAYNFSCVLLLITALSMLEKEFIRIV